MIEVTLPIRLQSESNNTDHWTVKRKRKKMLGLAIKAALNSHSLPPLPLQITLTRIAPRTLDSDNLQGAFKASRDILSQIILGGRMGQRDNDWRIRWFYDQKKGKAKEYAIVICIEPLPSIADSCFSPIVPLYFGNEFGNPKSELLNRLWPEYFNHEE